MCIYVYKYKYIYIWCVIWKNPIDKWLYGAHMDQEIVRRVSSCHASEKYTNCGMISRFSKSVEWFFWMKWFGKITYISFWACSNPTSWHLQQHTHDKEWATVACAWRWIGSCIRVVCVVLDLGLRGPDSVVWDRRVWEIEDDWSSSEDTPEFQYVVYRWCDSIQLHAIKFAVRPICTHVEKHTHTSTHVQWAHKRNADNQAQEPGWEGQKKGFVRDLAHTHTHNNKMSEKTRYSQISRKDSST